MDNREIIIKLQQIEQYISKNTQADEIASKCDHNPYQQIGYYTGALLQVKADLQVLKEIMKEDIQALKRIANEEGR